jgi:predicted nucleotide-binding protein
LKVISKQKAISKLESLVEEAELVKKSRRGSNEFATWYAKVKLSLANIFGEASRHLREFNNIPFSLSFWHDGTPDGDFEDAFERGMTVAVSYLRAMGEEVAEYWEEEEEGPKVKAKVEHRQKPTKVFIVHGHDHGLKETVARFLSRLGLEPIILHEQPNQGRTIIEKFEHNAEVQFAVVLLTADDVGAPKKAPETVQDRARQNVVFEFGYFVGALGRERVCGLVQSGIEIPSDVLGVVYIPVDDAGQWRMLLIKELKAIWPELDANLAI